jgi:hypothetical protein
MFFLSKTLALGSRKGLLHFTAISILVFELGAATKQSIHT